MGSQRHTSRLAGPAYAPETDSRHANSEADVLHDKLVGPLVDVAGKHVEEVVDTELAQCKMLRAPTAAVAANDERFLADWQYNI
jgi:hypothetical protein